LYKLDSFYGYTLDLDGIPENLVSL